MENLRLVTPAISLGAVETLVTVPATTSHGKVDPAERKKQGISDGLVRVSVGIEAIEDIIADFDAALGVSR
jgi:cystathionine beta-lyase/cystathionine gamma-synthase